MLFEVVAEKKASEQLLYVEAIAFVELDVPATAPGGHAIMERAVHEWANNQQLRCSWAGDTNTYAANVLMEGTCSLMTTELTVGPHGISIQCQLPLASTQQLQLVLEDQSGQLQISRELCPQPSHAVPSSSTIQPSGHS